VIVLLTLDPWLSRSAGFALSVLATAGLLLFTRPLAALAARVMPRAVALTVAVPLAAQLACQPVLFLIAPQLTPYTLVANVLAEPAAAAVSVLGLIVCVLGVAVPGLAPFAAWLPWLPSAWIGAVAHFFAGLPFAVIPLTESLPAAAGSLLVVAVLVFALISGRRHNRITALAATALTVVAVVSTGLGIGGVIARDAAIPPDWQVAACDIGQGDAVLVRSGESTALVDVGPHPEPLDLCLDRLNVHRIDLLVLTHYDRDHVDGLSAVIGRVDRALIGPPDGAADEQLLALLESGGADLIDARRGLTGTLGAYGWAVLWPKPDTRLRGNDASVTVLFTGPLRMLFLGDLGERAQESVRGLGGIGPVDLVKVAHHGSADQSDRLYEDIGADAGLISAGADNDYGHPTPRLLALLARTATAAFRTDVMGLVTVSEREGRMTVWAEKRAPP
jgi:competence protein ComEC